ncbi:MAG: zinc ribbon domain-containing protein [Acidobacteriota bacterium]|nr:zinc ribbon domain-containing protein [Acidobacteriota bacterium]
MPIYEYKCLDCGLHIEKMQKVSEESLKVCEKCGGKLEKQWSLSGFQFKGAGWYVTDYAKKTGAGSAEKSDKIEKSEKSEKSEKAEKSSATESTAKAETASNKSNDDASGSKKEVKKD